MFERCLRGTVKGNWMLGMMGREKRVFEVGAREEVRRRSSEDGRKEEERDWMLVAGKERGLDVGYEDAEESMFLRLAQGRKGEEGF